MSTLEPPPSRVDKFIYIWKEWFSRLYNYLTTHTGGTSPTSPATGTNWNAHGNTAVGAATSPLVVSNGSFLVTGTTGNTPSEFESAVDSAMGYVVSKKAFRAGFTSGTEWADANIGNQSAAFGNSCTASGANAFAVGRDSVASGNNSFAAGRDATAGANNDAIALGRQATASGLYSFAAGFQSTASATNGVAIGQASEASDTGATAVGFNCAAQNTSAVAVGQNATATQSTAISIGGYANASAANAVAIGLHVSSTAAGAVTIGKGITSASRLVNNDADSLYMGVGTTTPTIILTGGKCGVIETSPNSTFEVAGSTGYKYTYITTDKTLGASDNELVLICDLYDGTTNNITVTLPAISTCPRRIYHIKAMRSATGGTPGTLTLQPNASDSLPQGASGSGAGTIGTTGASVTVSLGNAPMIIADDTNNCWWYI